MNRLFLILLALASSCVTVTAQSPPGRTCGAEARQAELMQDPDYALRWTRRMQKARALLERRENGLKASSDVLRIPVAFHFQRLDGTADTACLRAMATRQLEVLNNDFQALNADLTYWNDNASGFFPDVSNGASCIEFCLPDRGHPAGFGLSDGDPAVTINATGSEEFLEDWPGYLHVFVRKFELLGEAPMGGGFGDGDGVIISNRAFGFDQGCPGVVPAETYNMGRTLTHEVGHYFSLAHIWGNGCGADDGIGDTPDQESFYNGCPEIGPASSTCGSIDLHVNYMDYVNDRCMVMFSAGQVAMMEAYVTANFTEITEGTVCDEPVATVSFVSPATTVPEGDVNCNTGTSSTILALPLTVSVAPQSDLSVDFFTSGTATPGEDLTLSSPLVVFPAGQTDTQYVMVEVHGDATVEDLEVLNLGFNLSATGGSFAVGAEPTHSISLENDDFEASTSDDIQTEANLDAGGSFAEFGPSATVDFYDKQTGKLVMTLRNISSHDFGCTQVSVVRGAGVAPGAMPSPAPQAGYLTDKTFFVSPEHNNFSAPVLVRLYYTAAEVAGFAAETQQPADAERLFSSDNFIAQATQLTEAVTSRQAFGANHYYEGIFTSGLSGFALGTVSAVLPVEMHLFTATAEPKVIRLDWSTTREENNYGFTVTRRAAHERAFTSLGWVAGNQQISGSAYVFHDRTAAAGTTYFYQLLQRDTDGTETASTIVSARLQGDNRIDTWPNPAGNLLNVTLATPDGGQLRLSTTDGRTVVERTFVSGGARKQLDLSALPTGVYLLVVETAGETMVRKIVRR